jgi:hypothetical protein
MKYFLFGQFLLLFFSIPICLADVNTGNDSIQEDVLRVLEQIDKDADSYLQNTATQNENIIVEPIDYRRSSQIIDVPIIKATSQVKQKKYDQSIIKLKRVIPQPKKIVKSDKGSPANKQSSALNQISELLDNWANSWSNGNVDAYINFYSKDYSPTKISRKRWLANRRKLIKPERKIKIKISQIKLQYIKKNEMISSRFTQKFSSTFYSDTSKKQLIWKKINGDWVISSENTIQ